MVDGMFATKTYAEIMVIPLSRDRKRDIDMEGKQEAQVLH